MRKALRSLKSFSWVSKRVSQSNYHSFTYNLVQYFGELGAEVEVHRNDQITVADAAAKKPGHIVLSPGLCTSNEAGIYMEWS